MKAAGSASCFFVRKLYAPLLLLIALFWWIIVLFCIMIAPFAYKMG
ncbi:hypothetical protein [Cytobacillus sp. BC1816]